MGVRLKEIGGGTNWLAPYLTATQILASSNEGLSRGIAQAGDAIGGGIRHKKDADRQQAQFNASLAQSDSHFQQSRLDSKDARDAAKLERASDNARDWDKFNANLMLRQMEDLTKQSDVYRQMSMPDSMLGTSGDPAAAAKLAETEKQIESIRGSLMAIQSRGGSASNSRAPEMTGTEYDDASKTTAHLTDDSSVPPPRTVTKAAGCRKGEPCDDKYKIDVPETSPVNASAKGSPDSGTPPVEGKSAKEYELQARQYEALFQKYSRMKGGETRAKKAADLAQLNIGLANAAASKEKEAENADKARLAKVDDAKKKADELIAWNGDDPGMRQHLTGVDFNDEATQHRINQLHGYYKDEHDLAKQEREASIRDAHKSNFTGENREQETSSARIAYKDVFGKEAPADMTATDLRSAVQNERMKGRATTAYERRVAEREAKSVGPEFSSVKRDYARALREYQSADAAYVKIKSGESIMGDEAAAKALVDERAKALNEIDDRWDSMIPGSEPWAKDPEYLKLTDAQKAEFRKKIGK